eukprot:TRINITY_DN5320_c0_g1_i2.p1 TRINITY_DN5320_c0_g1~~TRINITY_DN5320_c0_g1_i2.p1  ORF type:complete len:352 (-),score=62.01 TRINITY_DN5320_c0_g1_i2:276-1292(-)
MILGNFVSPAVFAVLLYSGSSIGIMFINKITLTTYGFSADALAICQYICTLVILFTLKFCKYIDVPLHWQHAEEMHPLPLLFMANTVTGLHGTKALSLPMFSVLRRFSIFLTMICEYFFLGRIAKRSIQVTVFMMLGGAILAAVNDFSFDAWGYGSVLLYDLFTALNNVYTKKKADVFGEVGVLFYNTVYTFPLLVLMYVVFRTSEMTRMLSFPYWKDPGFLLSLTLSSMMGCLIQYSTIICTKYTSPLTTTVVGCLKNIVTTYAGMLLADYAFSMWNFVGLNVSIAGSLAYSYYVFVSKDRKPVPSSLPLSPATFIPVDQTAAAGESPTSGAKVVSV